MRPLPCLHKLILKGRTPDFILVPHTQVAQRHVRQEAAGAIGQRPGEPVGAFVAFAFTSVCASVDIPNRALQLGGG